MSHPSLLIQELVHFAIVTVFNDLVHSCLDIGKLSLEEGKVIGRGNGLGGLRWMDWEIAGFVPMEKRLHKGLKVGRATVERRLCIFTRMVLPGKSINVTTPTARTYNEGVQRYGETEHRIAYLIRMN
jgi:hypothetical protein